MRGHLIRRIRGVRHDFESSEHDQACYFCGENAAEDSCQITVPMCGDPHPVDLLFCEGAEYRYGDVAVPRCRRCRDEHRELPGRIEQWHEARLAAADPEHFPDMMKEFESTRITARQAAAVVAERKKEVADAQAGVDEAAAIGQHCDRCHAKIRQPDLCLCRKCDHEAFNLGSLSKAGIASIIGAALFAFFALHSFLPSGILLCGAVVLFVVLKQKQLQRRRELGEKRQKETAQRRTAFTQKAKEQFDHAVASLKSAEQAAQKPVNAHEDAKKKLETARQRAVAEFERTHPKPELAHGVSPESAYSAFARIKELTKGGWCFGHQWNEGGQSDSDHPVNVSGLVAAEPCLARGRVLVSCPKCKKRQRVAKKGVPIEVNCSCGNRFTCLNGELDDPSKSGRVSSQATTGRARIRELARQSGADRLIACPICAACMKAKDLVRHYDQNHQGIDVPQTSPNSVKKNQAQQNVASTTASCPRCGSASCWDGTTCTNCDYPNLSEESDGTLRPNCPHCGKRQVVAASNRGSTVRCMSCGRNYEVGSRVVAAEVVAAEVVDGPSAAESDVCPRGHGRLREFRGKLRCWTCGWPEK
jgi:hypothetical protein